MTSTVPTKTISISINRSFEVVNDFLATPENFQHWASGLGKNFKRVGDEWIVEAPEGVVKVRFTPKNTFGVIDHYVILPSHVQIYIPLRVIANGEGSEVLLTIFHLPDVTPEKFSEDAEWVRHDLEKLKALLEA